MYARKLYPTANNPEEYEKGKHQAEIQEDRYHKLRAAIEKKYRILDNIVSDNGFPFPRQGISFEPYTVVKLETIKGFKLHPFADGTVHPDDLEIYHDMFKTDWNHAQSGILYNIGEAREFWNCILNYHSPAGTTGNEEWDALFEKLKGNGFRKDCLPCMFFNRFSGCLDPTCPYIHDAAEAHRIRAKILDVRRQKMLKPTSRQCMNYLRAKDRWHGARPPPPVPFATEPQIDRSGFNEELAHFHTFDALCVNPNCKMEWLKGTGTPVPPPLNRCSRCKWAFYCSPACQSADWKRHKKEPCAPLEEMVANDELWHGDIRKGTEMVDVTYG
ncbi:uncharacterized protein STEHIDRAFT_137218 [Stereum hirsutum FP-91666 SS1]|uniref:uncharacterized protein n=1 Tax=Stereum hirsutum (strain FP-91666) TaxID=721885 RepID=UPI000440E482|nr:uncharacterized protein STEHIDRAFT_137218 [Stereum hirsutum FP-91666 SS1]EIM91580.1 hypothetical protein STEHIDRAFT_137218 [Stereum hirsutum FP-91666 SS1]